MSIQEHSTTDKKRGPKPTPVEIAVDDPRSYMRFVATAAVDLLGYPSRAEAAERGLGMKPSNLSAQLNRAEGPTVEFLSKIECHYLAKGNSLHNGEPWLTSFHQELQAAIEREAATDRLGPPDPLLPGAMPRPNGEAGNHRTTNGDRTGPIDAVRVPAGWFNGLAERPPENATEVFVRSHALRSLLAATDRASTYKILRGLDLEDRAKATVGYLLDVAGGPPHLGQQAVRIVADLAASAAGEVQQLILDQVNDFIETSPVGFRVVRVLGRILYLQRSAKDPDQELLQRVGQILNRIYLEEERVVAGVAEARDPYPARSLFVEALRFAPDRAEDPDWSWTTRALLARTAPTCPTRERAYAAYVLFNREKDEARQVMEEFRCSDDEGLTYAAAFLDMLFKRHDLTDDELRLRYPYPWPHDRREHGIVEVATFLLATVGDQEVPHAVKKGLRELLRGALLTIDGTTRRRICESIQAAGLGRSAVKGLEAVIANDKSPRWLVEHAAFIIGYLQTGYADGAGYAIDVLSPLAADRSQASAVRHAALWGIGDIVGSVGNSEHEHRIAPLLARCSEREESDINVRRAAAYTAAILTRRSTIAKRRAGAAVSRVLASLAKDEDALVARLAMWAL